MDGTDYSQAQKRIVWVVDKVTRIQNGFGEVNHPHGDKFSVNPVVEVVTPRTRVWSLFFEFSVLVNFLVVEGCWSSEVVNIVIVFGVKNWTRAHEPLELLSVPFLLMDCKLILLVYLEQLFRVHGTVQGNSVAMLRFADWLVLIVSLQIILPVYILFVAWVLFLFFNVFVNLLLPAQIDSLSFEVGHLLLLARLCSWLE